MKKSCIIFLFVLGQSVVYSQTKTVCHKTTLKDIADSIETSVQQKDPSYVNRIFDLDEMLNSIFLDKPELFDFNKGFRKGFKNRTHYGETIVNSVGEKGDYQFLRVVEQNDQCLLLFRKISDEGGLDYHQFLIKEKNGAPIITDVYIFSIGDFLSETLKSVYIPFATQSLMNDDERDGRLVSDLNLINRIKELYGEGNFHQALSTYDELSDSIRHTKAVAMLKVVIGSRLNTMVHDQFTQEYLQRFPNDGSFTLLGCQHYMELDQYDEAWKCIEKLDSLLGGDPFLDLWRADVLRYENQYKEAVVLAEKVVHDMPRIYSAYNELLDIYVEMSRFEDALNLMDTMIAKFNLKRSDMKERVKNDYTFMAQSRQYKAWSKK